ncbi:MAG: hypothetical protein ACM3VW_06025 [Bacteroidota bacterium]
MRRLMMVSLILILPALCWAQTKPVPIELANPGFEQEMKGWDNADNPELIGVFTVEQDTQHSGKFSLHMQSQEPGQWPWVSTKIDKVDPGATYLAKVWFRGAEPSDSAAVLKLEFLNEKGEVVGSRYVKRPLPNAQWLQMGVQDAAPAEAVSGKLYLRLVGSTEVWFDDLELARVGDPPALVAKPARLALQPGEAKQVHLEVVSAAELPDPVEAKLSVTDPSNNEVKDVKGALARKDAHTLAGDISLPALSPGTHVWRVKLPAGSVEGRIFVALSKRQPKYLTDQGFLKIGQQPVFPIGLYHVSVADYATIAKQGFNAVQGLASQEPRLLKTALQEAIKAKLLVDIPLHYAGMVAGNMTASQQKLQYFAKEQAISGWKLADEPDQHPEIADEVPEAYQRLKQKDEQRPLLLTVERPDTYEYWANFCDALQVVCLPIPGQPLTMVSDRVAAARKVLLPWQHLSVLLQAGWLPGAANQPSFDQARAMVYLAVINGAQGIYWYSYRDPGWQLMDSPLWEKFADLNAETAKLGGVAISSVRSAVENDNPKLQAAGFTAGERLQVMMVNPTAEAQTATLKLAKPAAKTEITSGKATLEIKEGALAVTLEPLGAALVAVETAK